MFLTGDIHSAWACDLPFDAGTYPVGDTVGAEFVCTSVTSNNLKDITGSPPRTTSLAVEEAIKANNRHVKYLNFDDHGFSVLDITPKRAQMDYFVISDRADRDATISARASWVDPVRHADGSRLVDRAGRGWPMTATAAARQPAYLRSRPAPPGCVVLLERAAPALAATGPQAGLRAGRRRLPARRDHAGPDPDPGGAARRRAATTRGPGRCR